MSIYESIHGTLSEITVMLPLLSLNKTLKNFTY